MTHATDRRLKVLQRHFTELLPATVTSAGVLHAHTAQSHAYDFAFSPPVLEALQQGRPVVALESTIITHGKAVITTINLLMPVNRIVLHF
jgi:hypothetical protein